MKRCPSRLAVPVAVWVVVAVWALAAPAVSAVVVDVVGLVAPVGLAALVGDLAVGPVGLAVDLALLPHHRRLLHRLQRQPVDRVKDRTLLR